MIRRATTIAALAVFASLAVSPAEERESQQLKQAARETATVVKLTVGEQQSLASKDNVRITRVEHFDGELLVVKARTRDSIVLSGQAKGISRLTLTDETGQAERLFVIIE
jgi:hypothetical protein